MKTYPGYLYAKSLRLPETPLEGYKKWFCNERLASCLDKIESLRSSFAWRPDSSRRHKSVVVLEGADRGEVLVVRFMDAGKDSFSRPQTLRVEAMAVPAEEAMNFLDGTYVATPVEEIAGYRVEFAPGAQTAQAWKGERLVQGEEGTFSLAGVSSSSRTSAVRNEAIARTSEDALPGREAQAKKNTGGFWLVALALALIVSVALDIWLLMALSASRNGSRERISRLERDLEDSRGALAKSESELFSLEAFREQGANLGKTISDLREICNRLEKIKSAIDEHK